MDLLDPTPAFECYLAVRRDGTCRRAVVKFDQYDEAAVLHAWRAAIVSLTEWAQEWGVHVGGVIGDGGPEYVKLKAKLYQQAKDLELLRARLADLEPA